MSSFLTVICFVYFDNAATSFPKPDCVTDAVVRFLRDQGAAAGRGGYRAAVESGRLLDRCRSRIADLFGAERSEQIVFTFNCTDSLNLILNGLLRHGDHVIATMLEHNSVLRPLEELRESRNVSAEHIRFDPANGLLDLDSLQKALMAQSTRLVAINHASNVTGVVQPIAAAIELAHQHGALVLLDAAQTAGHLPFHVRDLDVDFVAAAGHKGLLGPLGTGVLYVRPGLESKLRPTRCGGTGSQSESINQPDTLPQKLESGNPNVPGIAGLNAALEWLADRGIDAVHQKAAAQTARLRDALAEISAVHVVCPQAADVIGVVSITVDGVDCREIAAILDQSFDIQCRSGLHCAPLVHRCLGTDQGGGTLRLSPGVFTTDDEINAVIEGVRQVSAAMSG